MRTYTNWSKKNLDELICFVEKYNKQGKSNMEAFKDFSKEHKLNVFTIRNLYYKILRENGTTKIVHKFSEEETRWLVSNVQKLKSKGSSTRSACLELANNDKSLFLRYLNKYNKLEKIRVKNGNIITIKPQNKGLTDDDINNLIKGFVGLIKKNAVHDINLKYKTIINDYNARLNNTIIELNKKNNLLKDVLIENELLKSGKLQNLNKLDKILEKINN